MAGGDTILKAGDSAQEAIRVLGVTSWEIRTKGRDFINGRLSKDKSTTVDFSITCDDGIVTSISLGHNFYFTPDEIKDCKFGLDVDTLRR